MNIARNVVRSVGSRVVRDVVRSVARNVARIPFFQSPGSHSLSLQDLIYMTSKEDAVSREAPASLEARFTADRSTFSKKTLLFIMK